MKDKVGRRRRKGGGSLVSFSLGLFLCPLCVRASDSLWESAVCIVRRYLRASQASAAVQFSF